MQSHPDRDEMRDALALSLIYLIDAASAQVEVVLDAVTKTVLANPVVSKRAMHMCCRLLTIFQLHSRESSMNSSYI